MPEKIFILPLQTVNLKNGKWRLEKVTVTFFQVIHEEMMDMHRSGFISDARMREFDEMCLTQEDETGPEAENSPKKEHVTA